MRPSKQQKVRSNLSRSLLRTKYYSAFGTLAVLLLALTTPFLLTASAAGANTLSKVSSGLVHQDALTSPSGPDASYWTFSGDAPQVGGQYAFNENTSGLYIGVASPAANVWAGFYAESPNSNVLLFHTLLTLRYPSLVHNSFNTGLYVQTYNGMPICADLQCYAHASAS
jgi:hypothetical protein